MVRSFDAYPGKVCHIKISCCHISKEPMNKASLTYFHFYELRPSQNVKNPAGHLQTHSVRKILHC